MSCIFITNAQGNIIDVREENGAPSKLYQQAYNEYGNREKAIDIVAASLDKNYFGDGSLKSVSDFIAQENKIKTPLTAQQNQDLKNTLLSLNIETVEQFQSQLKEAFYKGEIFNPTLDSLTKSGLYSPFEVKNILSDIDLQNKIKNAVEALNNTDLEITEYDNFDSLEKANEINSFGKFTVLNPYVVQEDIVQALGGVKTQSEFDDKISSLEYPNFLEKVDETTFEQMKDYVRVPYLETIPKTDTFSTVTLGMKAGDNSTVISAIDTLVKAPDQVLAENENTEVLLNKIQRDLAAQGLDVIGLSADKPFLKTLQAFLINPSVENTNSFVGEYNRLFEIDDAPAEKVLKLPNNRNYVYSESNEAEDVLLERDNIIKAKDNLYIKVRRQPIETLRDIVGEAQGIVENINNPDYNEELTLLKKYFGVPLNIAPKATIVSDNLFTGNEDYLKNDFIADFQIAALKEKQKNSDQWKNFYNRLTINSKGIALKSVDPITTDTVNSWLKEINQKIAQDLQQYSLISKQLPILGEQEVDEVSPRTQAINNPLSVQRLNTESFKIDDENFIATGANIDIVRVGNRAYEATDTKNGLTLYTQLPINSSEYYSYKNRQPKSDVKLQDFAYLQSIPSKFMSAKKENGNIIKENFGCL